MQLAHCGGIPILDVEFQPFEYFLDSFCNKFRSFLNYGVYLMDVLLTKESLGTSGSDDIMSFDIKRPSVFLQEIKSYLNAASYISKITGANVVGILRDVWIEQTDLEKAKRYAASVPNELVFHVSNKLPRDRGKAVQINSIQPFLITLVQWYTEFAGSKAISDTTIFSPVHQSFCNRSFSSLQSEYFTDVHGITIT